MLSHDRGNGKKTLKLFQSIPLWFAWHKSPRPFPHCAFCFFLFLYSSSSPLFAPVIASRIKRFPSSEGALFSRALHRQIYFEISQIYVFYPTPFQSPFDAATADINRRNRDLFLAPQGIPALFYAFSLLLFFFCPGAIIGFIERPFISPRETNLFPLCQVHCFNQIYCICLFVT